MISITAVIKDHPKTPRRLLFSEGNWTLEVETYRTLSAGIFRPVTYAVNGADQILVQLAQVLAAEPLARSAQALMESPDERPRAFEARSGQWVLQANGGGASPAAYSAATTSGLPQLSDDLGDLTAVVKQLARSVEDLSARLRSVEAELDRLKPGGEATANPTASPTGRPARSDPPLTPDATPDQPISPEPAPSANVPQPISLPDPEPAAAVASSAGPESEPESLAAAEASAEATAAEEPAAPAPAADFRGIINATVDLFKEALGQSLSEAPADQLGTNDVLGATARILGSWCGSVCLLIPRSLAPEIAAIFLSESKDDLIEEEIHEALQELAKMLGDLALDCLPGPSYAGSPSLSEPDAATIQERRASAAMASVLAWETTRVEVLIHPD